MAIGDDVDRLFTTDEPWRFACPQGHRELRSASGYLRAYCPACRQVYGPDALRDMKDEYEPRGLFTP